MSRIGHIGRHKHRKTKKKKYEEEKIHFIRGSVLFVIAVLFILSALLSVYTFVRTREIVAHADVYRKQRDYSCSEETDNRELITTGAEQLLTVDTDMLRLTEGKSSSELNANHDFTASNPEEPELPLGYRYSTVGDVSASFLHDKVNHTLHAFANITGNQGGQAGWYMEYIGVEPGKAYEFKTTYILDKAKAIIVAEEVDDMGKRSYTDLVYLSPSDNQESQDLYFVPANATKQLRFFTQLTSLGSMNIYEESVRAIDNFELDEPLITVSFDDGWKSVYVTAKPLLDELDIKTSQFIIAESFRSLLAGYMDLGQVKNLAKQGHEIGSHSLRHCNLAQLDDSNLDYDINASKFILDSEFKDVRGLAYPYGSYDARVEAEAAKSYSYVRTTETGYDSLLMNRHRLRGVTITPEISFEKFKELVDTAVRNRLWINLIYHQVGDDSGEYAITSNDLRAQLQYLKSQPARIVKAGEAVDIITRQQNRVLDPTELIN